MNSLNLSKLHGSHYRTAKGKNNAPGICFHRTDLFVKLVR
jgi:hypothetical protein